MYLKKWIILLMVLLFVNIVNSEIDDFKCEDGTMFGKCNIFGKMCLNGENLLDISKEFKLYKDDSYLFFGKTEEICDEYLLRINEGSIHLFSYLTKTPERLVSQFKIERPMNNPNVVLYCENDGTIYKNGERNEIALIDIFFNNISDSFNLYENCNYCDCSLLLLKYTQNYDLTKKTEREKLKEIMKEKFNFEEEYFKEEIFGKCKDFNLDGKSYFDDFFLLADYFDLKKEDSTFDSKFDLDGDEDIDYNDFFIFTEYFGNDYLSFCNNGILDVCEEGIDCEGNCPNQDCCNNNFKDINEEGIDCGGNCDEICVTCDDGIINGDEEGVDCGGNCSNKDCCNNGYEDINEEGIDCGENCNNICIPKIFEFKISPPDGTKSTQFHILINIETDNRISQVVGYLSKEESPNLRYNPFNLYDDGFHGDLEANDGVFGSDPFQYGSGKWVVNFEIEFPNFPLQDKWVTFENFSYLNIYDQVNPNCQELMVGHNNLNENRINLVFYGVNYGTKEQFREIIKTTVDFNEDHGLLFSVEPFKSNKDKFNLWYVPDIFYSEEPEDILYAYGPDNIFEIKTKGNLGRESLQFKKKCLFENNHFSNFFVNWGFVSGALYGTNFISHRDDLEKYLGNRSVVFAHELGHSFSDLVDEYEFIKDPPIEWIEQTSENWINFNKQCYWGDIGECTQKAGWVDYLGNGCGEDGVDDCELESMEVKCEETFDSCIYSGVYRHMFNNIMRHPGAFNIIDYSFGVVNERIICNKIKELTGNVGGICDTHCLEECSFGERCIEGGCI